MIRLATLQPEHARALEQLQIDCFPTLAEHELLREEHFLSHCELFPEGNFVALDGESVIGLGSGFLIDFDFAQPNHSFQEIIAGGFYTHHDPDGDWYYGGDISVHPDYRGRGIARQLYDARKEVVKRLNRRGIVAGGLTPTYADYKDEVDYDAYIAKVKSGEIFGSTLSVQLRNGFRVVDILEDYIEDEASDNRATLIVWDNPDYRPPRARVNSA